MDNRWIESVEKKDSGENRDNRSYSPLAAHKLFHRVFPSKGDKRKVFPLVNTPYYYCHYKENKDTPLSPGIQNVKSL